MDSTEVQTVLADLEAHISELMPTALDMIGTIVDTPGSDINTYDRLLSVAEMNPPVLVLAILRCAAGLAAVSDMTGDQVRALAP